MSLGDDDRDGRGPGDGGGVSAAGDFSLVSEWNGAVFLL